MTQRQTDARAHTHTETEWEREREKLAVLIGTSDVLLVTGRWVCDDRFYGLVNRSNR